MFITQKVESSAINEVSYDKETKILRIQFKHGAEYDYPDVPEYEFKNLVCAPSIGRYYNTNIKKYAVRAN